MVVFKFESYLAHAHAQDQLAERLVAKFWIGGECKSRAGSLDGKTEKEKKKRTKCADRLIQRIGESRVFQRSTAAALFDRGGGLESAALVKMLSINETRSRGGRNGDQDVETDTPTFVIHFCKDTSRADV